MGIPFSFGPQRQSASEDTMGNLCTNCGAPLKPGTKFCGNCGVKQENGAPEPLAAPVPSAQPLKAKRKKPVIIVAILGAVIAISMGGWLLIPRLFPSGKESAVTYSNSEAIGAAATENTSGTPAFRNHPETARRA